MRVGDTRVSSYNRAVPYVIMYMESYGITVFPLLISN